MEFFELDFLGYAAIVYFYLSNMKKIWIAKIKKNERILKGKPDFFPDFIYG